MISDSVLKAAEMFAEKNSHPDGAHDFSHIDRVRKMAVHIAKEEGADIPLVELAALLHDVDDHKFLKGEKKVLPWLKKNNISPSDTQHILTIIDELSFRGAKVQSKMSSLEGKVVQDADRLDALGAIGIARALSYGGFKGIPLHDPSFSPTLHNSFAEYKKQEGTTINHFYEKLFFLKDLMNTNTAKKLAEHRHAFMEKFIKEFLDEWKMEYKLV